MTQTVIGGEMVTDASSEANGFGFVHYYGNVLDESDVTLEVTEATHGSVAQTTLTMSNGQADNGETAFFVIVSSLFLDARAEDRNGTISTFRQPYDPVAHRFLKFSTREKPNGRFEVRWSVSPDDTTYTDFHVEEFANAPVELCNAAIGTYSLGVDDPTPGRFGMLRVVNFE